MYKFNKLMVVYILRGCCIVFTHLWPKVIIYGCDGGGLSQENGPGLKVTIDQNY